MNTFKNLFQLLRYWVFTLHWNVLWLFQKEQKCLQGSTDGEIFHSVLLRQQFEQKKSSWKTEWYHYPRIALLCTTLCCAACWREKRDFINSQIGTRLWTVSVDICWEWPRTGFIHYKMFILTLFDLGMWFCSVLPHHTRLCASPSAAINEKLIFWFWKALHVKSY